MTTITLTPESEGRPLTAADVHPTDTVTLLSANGYSTLVAVAFLENGRVTFDFLGKQFLSIMLTQGWGITKLERPIPDVPEQVELPSKPGFYQDSRGSVWSRYGDGFFMVGVEEQLDVSLYAPFTRLVPAGSEREAALREAADVLVRAKATMQEALMDAEPLTADEDADAAQALAMLSRIEASILALVPEAEGEKA